ncbi:MAG: ribosomal protein L7/L12 [Massilia sp.]|nr:ribosomal protein L7/L12 [Massilia sp.]
MAISKEEFLDAVGAMSVMELNDLVKAFEEKFGVSAAAMSAPAAGGGVAAAAVEEQTEFNVAKTVKEALPKADAEAAKKKLEEAGAKAELK